MLGCGVRRVTHCAPAALRSDRRGESVDEARVWPAAHPRHPPSCAPPAHTEGGWEPHRPTAPREAALQLPGLLQRTARFIDFSEEDLKAYTDADLLKMNFYVEGVEGSIPK